MASFGEGRLIIWRGQLRVRSSIWNHSSLLALSNLIDNPSLSAPTAPAPLGGARGCRTGMGCARLQHKAVAEGWAAAAQLCQGMVLAVCVCTPGPAAPRCHISLQHSSLAARDALQPPISAHHPLVADGHFLCIKGCTISKSSL